MVAPTACTLYGAKSCGMRSLLNAFSGRATRLNVASNSSMRFWLKLAASRKCVPSFSNHVRPVNTAPFFDSSTSVIAVDRPAVMGVAGGPQPAIVPFLVAKMKAAGLLAASAKSVVPLKIIPVGLDGPSTPLALGMVTSSGTVAPAPENSDAVPVLSLFVHQGDEALRASPQGFFKFGSTSTVVPSAFAGWEISDTRFF